MAVLKRWEPQGVDRLHQDVTELFNRFFDRADWTPRSVFRSMRSFHDEMDDLLGSFFGPAWGSLRTGTATPRVETNVKDGYLVMKAEVPGYSPDEVKVNLAGDTLQIEAEHKAGEGEQQERHHFAYRYTLPEPVDPEQVKANLHHGVLEIQLPASPKLTGKQIPIHTGSGEEQKKLKAA